MNSSSAAARGLALAVLIVAVAMAMLDTTIVNVALPTLRSSIGADEATLSWIISGYSLASGLALIPAGRIGDRIGHKPVFLTGLAAFTIASLACGLSHDAVQLIVARVVQGLGAGVFFPAVVAFIQLLFAGRARGRAFAVMGATIGLATALGPLIGGLIIEALGADQGWRWIFFVNVPIGALALGAGLWLLPRRRPERPAAAGIDLPGAGLLTLGLVAILVPLIEGEQLGWPLWTWVSIVAGVVLIALFGAWEVVHARRGRVPLVPPRLFAHPSFAGGVVLAFVYFAGFTSIFFTLSLLWQAGLQHSALETGLMTIPFSIGAILGAALSERLAHSIGRTVLAIGTGLLATGLVALWLVTLTVPSADLTSWLLLAPLAAAGVGSGLFIGPNAQFITATVDRTEAGAASGVISTVQRIGAAMGIAIVGSVLFASLDPALLAQGRPDAAFGGAAAGALAVSAAFAIVAFVLVFVLPKRVPDSSG